MQMNVVQSFTNAATAIKTSTKDYSADKKDFNEVLKTEKEVSEAKTEKPKDESVNENQEEVLDATQVLVMPNVQELLNNIIKTQEEKVDFKAVNLENLQENTKSGVITDLKANNEESSDSQIKILDLNLLKSTQEIPEDLKAKIDSLEMLKGKSENENQGEKTSAASTENSHAGILQQTENLNNLEVINVKNPAPMEKTITSEYMNDINSKIAENISLGKNEFEIQLSPENLGTLTIKASFEDGKSVVSIICADLKALEAVGKSADDLALIIQNKTGNETQIVVESPRSDYLDNNADENQHQNQSDNQNQDGKKEENENPQDFLQQLRLGLTNV